MSQKSYNNNTKLYLIPTPIGNMDDITLRAINTLKEVEVIFCEDTRVTGLLLKHLNIKKKLISNHLYNEENNYEKLLSYLEKGLDVGLVSDRGTPIISDPGYALARFAIEKGYNVIGLPGPTALISALIASGLPPMPFLFYGFLNNKEGKRKSELEDLKNIKATLIFYEAPHRIEKTLENMEKTLGNRQISISREISKRYEEVYRGKISDVKEEVKDAKGEFVIIVEPAKEENYEDLSILEHVNLFIEQGLTPNDAIKKVAKLRNVNKNTVYREYHEKKVEK